MPPALPPTPDSRTDRNQLIYNLIRVCPECAGPIIRNSGCLHCAQCGWGRCG